MAVSSFPKKIFFPDIIHINQVMSVLILGFLLFLGGMRFMSHGLSELWGSAFSAALNRLTGNRFTAFLCGLLFTSLTQSSSLATVLVVGATDAGLLPLPASIAVIIGANVGTTVTGQLLSFQIQDYALLILGAGLLFMFPGGRRKRNAGRSLAGLGILLYGLKLMAVALAPLTAKAWFLTLLQESAVHPVLGVAAGAALSAVIQSSSAVMGVVLSLAQESIISLSAGVAVMIGADVGTCLTALLAAMGGTVPAKRAAFAHLLFNLCSAAIVLPVFPYFIKAAAATSTALPRSLANAHTLYNLTGAAVLLFLFSPFQTLVEKLIRAGSIEKKRISCILSEVIRKWF
ncbi:MAG: Na/Pi symporter [Bacillota bacterium]|jgi:phosphate:Na+ symporter|nr:Na/Pi symporter [Bacillota bacterium]HHU29548.1 Na/Pi cotransporter family protein [Bacillota bacterium]